ncbi:TPA: helix-turn-helix transcriptional regulator, partial [Streptococcus suis]
MNRLKKLRQEKKLTQEELASEIGVSKMTVSNWENNKHAIKSDKAQALADYFEVNLA